MIFLVFSVLLFSELAVRLSSGDGPERYSISNKLYTRSWTKSDWDPSDSDQDQRILDSISTFSALAVDVEAELSAITIEEVLEAHENDPEFRAIRRELDGCRNTPFIEDERGLIIRVAEVDGICQIFVPRKLRQRIFHLVHHTPLAGHPGMTRQFYTMRSEWYWPAMIVDIRKVSQHCHACTNERLRILSHQAPLQLFRPKRNLESIVIDILGPLTRSTSGHKFILVITDRFSSMQLQVIKMPLILPPETKR